MKAYLKKLKQITVASLITMILYILVSTAVAAFMNSMNNAAAALWVYSLLFSAAFAYMLIYVSCIRTGDGELAVGEDFKDGYPGFKSELSGLLRRELTTLKVIFAVNILSWLLIRLDLLLFSKRTFSAILLIYAPLNIVSSALPDILAGLPGYILGSLLVGAAYLVELTLLRKKWHEERYK